MFKKIGLAGLAAAALMVAAGSQASAQDYYGGDHGWRDHERREWREHERREHEWREHERREWREHENEYRYRNGAYGNSYGGAYYGNGYYNNGPYNEGPYYAPYGNPRPNGY